MGYIHSPFTCLKSNKQKQENKCLPLCSPKSACIPSTTADSGKYLQVIKRKYMTLVKIS